MHRYICTYIPALGVLAIEAWQTNLARASQVALGSCLLLHQIPSRKAQGCNLQVLPQAATLLFFAPLDSRVVRGSLGRSPSCIIHYRRMRPPPRFSVVFIPHHHSSSTTGYDTTLQTTHTTFCYGLPRLLFARPSLPHVVVPPCLPGASH